MIAIARVTRNTRSIYLEWFSCKYFSQHLFLQCICFLFSMNDTTVKKYISCVLPLPIFSCFTYEVPEGANADAGVRVRVPFGNKTLVAIVIESLDIAENDAHKIKLIEAVLDDQPLFSSSVIAFLIWVADYYMQPIGEVLFLALPSYLKKGTLAKLTTVPSWLLKEGVDIEQLNLSKKAPKQYQILSDLQSNSLTATDLNLRHTHWRPIVKALIKKDWVAEQTAEQFEHNIKQQAALLLNTEQQQISQNIKQGLDSFNVHIIDGITGSGKTEVYFDVMQETLEQGKQVLFMLPEIGLTNAFIQRICQRFGNNIAVIHSAKTAWQRYIAWDQIKRGAANILIATRSGVFVDFKQLGLIVVDEEHDSSYRQEDGVYYHGRDCAVKRAQMLNIPIVMGSATLSIETLKNCEDGHYHRHVLNERAKKAQLAQMQVINTLDKPLQSGCSQTLIKAIKHHLKQQGQIILFLNRRGFAPILMCHDCGWRKTCSHCETQMSLHLSVNRMVCHHCAQQQIIPHKCGDCGSTDIQHYGIGTQQLEEKINQLFPDVLVERIDRDSTRLKDEFNQKLALLQKGESGIFIGTQMLAKGHDYEGISLVGILNMDQGLHSTQYRATERLAQTIVQVSGRAGRGEQAGEVLLQTDFPEHELMPDIVAQDYRSIAQKLLEERSLLGLPPYLKVIMFRADAMTLDDAEAILLKIKERIEQEQVEGVQCVGPFPSYLKKQEGRYRAQMHCSSLQLKILRNVVKQLMPELVRLKKQTHTKWRVDVDPMDI